MPGTPTKGQDHSPGGGCVAELGVLRVEKSRPEDGDPLPLFIPLTPAHHPFWAPLEQGDSPVSADRLITSSTFSAPGAGKRRDASSR